ncbi:ATP-dependent DNA ligase [Cellulosimicrobium protaetiae]|uniref:ATP-dependent DNA ligase n=1 Tax=Cellulosimicrobium protaetiae TaxID=2587808 RepID=A0A6M5UIZ0_9MICO|nr:ATP-dependent DNA ligase [Cellulosimicrobium protaetiae]QJW38677.1 ATP-dependent DNA ligase [Cellulosimicrobium protaetiae]
MPFGVALARAVEKMPAPGALEGGCRFEPKWDGYRALVDVGEDEASVWSRRGTDLSATFPEITTAAHAQLPPRTVLDGELVIWLDGRLTFEALQERMGRGPRTAASAARARPASLAAFDVLALEGRDIRSRPFDERRALLVELAASWRPPLNLSPVTADADEAAEWFETYAVVGVEGLVVKGGAQPYRADRIWLKVKHRSTIDVVCAAVTGSRSQPQEIVAGLPIEGDLRVVGRTTPLTPAARRHLAPLLRPPEGEHPWPARISPGTFERFNPRTSPIDLALVEPFVVEVSADVAWNGKSFRHGLRFLRARPDAEVDAVRPPTAT